MTLDQTTLPRKVKVQVKEVLPSGLVVRILENDSEGFIPKRELSWDRSMTYHPRIPVCGEELEAVLLPYKRRTRQAYLSVRRLQDPWAAAHGKYTNGQIIRGEVVNLRRFAAFVQLEPGITAIVHPSALPLQKDQLPEDLLSLGDQVQGIIQHYDEQQHRCELSLLDYLQQLPITLSERLSTQVEIFLPKYWARLQSDRHHPTLSSSAQETRQVYRPPMMRFVQALVLDDNHHDCQRLHDHLVKRFAIVVDIAHAGEEAMANIAAGAEYDLAVIDVHLGNALGVTAAEQLLALLPEMRVIFTSSDPKAESEIPRINGREYRFVLKLIPEIIVQVDMECHGYWETVRTETAAYVGRDSFVQHLEMEAFTRRPLAETLQVMLEKLQAETRASYVILLETDAPNKLAHIVATAPVLQAEVAKQSLDGLYYSPLREVVETETRFHETKRHDHAARFRYFFPKLSYKACYGTPLTIPGLAPRHALFLLDEQRLTFTEDTLRRVELAAEFIKIALERSLLLDFMHRYEERYSLGQLLGSLVHELRTKLNGLDAQSSRLETVLAAADYEKARDAAQKIARTGSEVRELVESYSRMAKGDSEAVDVNAVVEKVRRELETQAKEARVKIKLQLQPNLSPVNAIQSRLEQVVLNVMLNAIQQIQHQAKEMAKVKAQLGQLLLLQEGVLFVQTFCNVAAPDCVVRIIVLDSGPGIHYDQREHIFRLNTSTYINGYDRLGLFINRNLIETMGGRLYLADSIIFVGSLFVVEVPQYVPKQE